MRTTRMSRPAVAVMVSTVLVALTACQADVPDDAASASPPAPSATETSTGVASDEPTPTGTPGETSPGEPGTNPGEVPAGAPYEDGYQPAWFEGTPWSCGMPAADLESVSEDYALDIAGDVTDVAGGEPSHNGDRFLPVTLTGPDGAVHVSPPATVWTQGGVVVQLPALADAAPVEVAGGDRLDAALGVLSHCVPGGEAEGMTRYETELPEGAYEVRAFVEVDPVRSPRQLVLSDAVDVAVTRDGIVQR